MIKFLKILIYWKSELLKRGRIFCYGEIKKNIKAERYLFENIEFSLVGFPALVMLHGILPEDWKFYQGDISACFSME